MLLLAPHFLALSVALTIKKAVKAVKAPAYELKKPKPSSLLLHVTPVSWP